MSKVDNIRVQQFIDWSMKVTLSKINQNDKDNPVVISKFSWLILKEKRRTVEYQDDYDASAAEHYMFARYMAGQSGDPIVQLAPTLYDIKKIYKFITGQEKSMRTDSAHPVLSPDSGIWKWGNKGAQDGLRDYKSINNNAKYNYGNSVKSFSQDAGYSQENAEKIGNYAKKIGAVVK